MSGLTDRLVENLYGALGGSFRDRRAQLAETYHAVPPLRPGGVRAIRYWGVHHTAGAVTGTYDQVWDLHVRRLGWSGPGYGIFIYGNGRVELGMSPDRTTWGVFGRHVDVYSIVVAGNWQAASPPRVQLDALYRVLCALDDAHGEGLPWRGHQELALPGHGTACPGSWLMPHLSMMRGPSYGAACPRPLRYP